MALSEQALRATRRILGGPLVAVEPVRVQQRALDEPGDDVVIDVVGHLPAQRAAPSSRRAPVHGRGRDARPLGVELGAGAQPDDDHAPAVDVRQRQALERRSGLAGLEQRPRAAARQIVRDASPSNSADDDRVRASSASGLSVVAATCTKPDATRI